MQATNRENMEKINKKRIEKMHFEGDKKNI